jgi:hypoxanthine phosphoribosyltransferase
VPITAVEAQKVYSEAECLYTNEQVQAAIDLMADRVTGVIGGRDPVILCVMTGGIILTGQLLPRLHFPLQLDYIHATRYANQTQGGQLTWIAKPRVPLAGRVVIVVDDILDEGITLAAIVKACKDAGATAVYSAVLVNKRHDRKNGFDADFVGLEVDDRYVFGFGMDYKGYLRNAKGIYAARES